MTRVSPFRLGLFILVCLGAGLAVLFWIGAARVLEPTTTYAAYFGEPVTGLEPGASVLHLGVKIGSVSSVDLAGDERVVRVLVDLRSSFKVDPSMALAVTQSGITGPPSLALEETPPAERRTLPHPATRHPVLPTRPGGGGLTAVLGGLGKKISATDLQGLVSAWEGVARSIETLTRGDVRAVLEDARATSAGIRRIAGAGPQGQPSELELVVRDLQASTRSLRTATAAITQQVGALPPGTVAEVAERVRRTTALGQDAVRNLDQNLGASLALLREDLAQLKQAVIEAQALARSLRAQPDRILERGGTRDPFKR